MAPKIKNAKTAAMALKKAAKPTKTTKPPKTSKIAKPSKITRPSKISRTSETPAPPRTDMALAMNDPHMQEIIDGTKTYEFRKYNMAGVKRIWFYRTTPYSAITHVCEVDAAATRNPGDAPIPEDGLGNKEYNKRHDDWDGYDYAYRIKSVREIDGGGITLAMMKDNGFKAAPRGRVVLPQSISAQYNWVAQTKIR